MKNEKEGYKQTFVGSQIWIRSKKYGIAKIHSQDLFHIWILDESDGCQLMLRLTKKGNVIEYIRQHDESEPPRGEPQATGGASSRDDGGRIKCSVAIL